MDEALLPPSSPTYSRRRKQSFTMAAAATGSTASPRRSTGGGSSGGTGLLPERGSPLPSQRRRPSWTYSNMNESFTSTTSIDLAPSVPLRSPSPTSGGGRGRGSSYDHDDDDKDYNDYDGNGNDYSNDKTSNNKKKKPRQKRRVKGGGVTSMMMKKPTSNMFLDLSSSSTTTGAAATTIPAAPSSKDTKQQGFWNMLAAAKRKWQTTNNNNNHATDDYRHGDGAGGTTGRRGTTSSGSSSGDDLASYMEGSSRNFHYDDNDYGIDETNGGILEDAENGGASGSRLSVAATTTTPGSSDTLLPTTYTTTNVENSMPLPEDDNHFGQSSSSLHQRAHATTATTSISATTTKAAGSSSPEMVIDDSSRGLYSGNDSDGNGNTTATPIASTMKRHSHVHPTGMRSSVSSTVQSPSYYNHHPTPIKKKKKKKVMSAFSCMPTNSLLIGGQYYPGKDKKRSRHYYNQTNRNKNVLLRIFCGTPTRQTISLFITAYILVYRIIIPISEYMIFGSTNMIDETTTTLGDGSSNRIRGGGKSRTTNSRSFFDSGEGVLERLQFDSSTFHFSSLKQEVKTSQQIVTNRQRLAEGGGNGASSSSSNSIHSDRMHILERIVPDWYHRFDPVNSNSEGSKNVNGDNLDNNNQQQHHQSEPSKSQPHRQHKRKHRSKTNNKQNVIKEMIVGLTNATQLSQDQGTTNTTDSLEGTNKEYSRRILQQIGGIATADRTAKNDTRPDDHNNSQSLPLRTIHNMNELGRQYSSCNRRRQTLESTTDNENQNIVYDDDGETHPTTTLVVQTSINRLWILNETCKRWNHDPIVAVVFVPYEEHRNEIVSADGDGTRTPWQRLQLLSNENLNCSNVLLVEYMASEDESQTGRYPVNRLRNVGLDLVETSHVLTIDVDFVPSQDLDLSIREGIIHQQRHETKSQEDTKNISRTALIVPAFEKVAPNCSSEEECASYLKKDSNFLPHSFEELVNCYKSESEDCTVFQSKVNWEGHSTTLSERWLRKEWYTPSSKLAQSSNNTEPSEDPSFREVTCFHTARYEPYLVLEWCPNDRDLHSNHDFPISPYYDERFYGYGKNKIELVSHVRKSGYRFHVLPEGFIIHNPHLESPTKQTWNDRGSNPLHGDMDQLYSSFLKELDTMYKDVHNDTIKLCPRSK